jgi:hypothetical protein
MIIKNRLVHLNNTLRMNFCLPVLVNFHTNVNLDLNAILSLLTPIFRNSNTNYRQIQHGVLKNIQRSHFRLI